jgi:hypothetical protein
MENFQDAPEALPHPHLQQNHMLESITSNFLPDQVLSSISNERSSLQNSYSIELVLAVAWAPNRHKGYDHIQYWHKLSAA